MHQGCSDIITHSKNKARNNNNPQTNQNDSSGKKKKITASTKLHRIWIKLNYKKTITSNKHTGMRYLSHSLKGAGKVAKLFLKIKVLVT